MRYHDDLGSMAVPQKYLRLGDFSEYWSPNLDDPPPKVAPFLTIFVGGNHENSDWLAEESYGGFLAPNIYYLGHSGVVTVDGCVCLAGLSGIFKGGDYLRPYPPRPYNSKESEKRSAYHVRKIEVEKLRLFSQTVGDSDSEPKSIHLFASHDWPTGITKYGNEEDLLRFKPYFADDIAHNALGNPNTLSLLRAAQPQYWLAAHLHCKFTATVRHSTEADDRTLFLALDKCPRNGSVDFVDVNASSTKAKNLDWRDRISRHPHWLRILKLTHNSVASNNCQCMQDKSLPTLSSQMLLAATSALTTSSLLEAMDLSPALPLHYTASCERISRNPPVLQSSRKVDASTVSHEDSLLTWDVDLKPS